MPRDGAIIFRDLVGKLDMLNVECDKCGRHGRYRLDRLIERYGIDAKINEWSSEVTADCPRRIAKNDYDLWGDPPDLPKVIPSRSNAIEPLRTSVAAVPQGRYPPLSSSSTILT